MRTIETIIIIGLIVSFSAFVSTAKGYRMSAMIAQSLDETRPIEDVMNTRIVNLLEKSQCDSETVQIMNSSIKDGVAKRKVLSALANDSKLNALTQGILWIGVLLIFIILFFKIKQIKRDNGAK